MLFRSPLVIIAIFLSFFAFYFSNNLLPVTNKKAKTLMWDIQKQNPTFSLQEGIFNDNLPGWSIKANKIDNRTNTLYDIIIYQHKSTKNEPITIVAEKGIIKNSKNIRFLNFILYNGSFYSENNERNDLPLKRGEFKKYIFPIKLPNIGFERSEGDHFKGEYKMLNISQLSYMRDSLNSIFHNIKQNYAVELQTRKYLKNFKKQTPKDTAIITTTNKVNLIEIFNQLSSHDSRTIEPLLTQMKEQLDYQPEEVVYDRGGKGKSFINGVKISTPGKALKTDTAYKRIKKRKKFRRRAAIEPVIGHLKQHFRLGQNYLHGAQSPKINAFLAATGWNLKKLMEKLEDKFLWLQNLYRFLVNIHQKKNDTNGLLRRD